ncbi:GNAT family N-acetyltransferase [Peribacillus kribbensis]|uniref:GNAT family N-acetyltransferase n=1 Tax=Peribacillus kribbensis TaxID=356658 RepID=UPI0004227F5E|nr:GNAT family N-acetyltransferase [Peribacillus kribbensis]
MYRKEFYIYNGDIPLPAVIRSYKETDFTSLAEMNRECFPPPFPDELLWNHNQLQNHVNLFPDGALCIEVGGEMAGSMTSLMVDYHHTDGDHSWDEITDRGYIGNHNPKGNTLYVVDISVRPRFRKLGLGKWLMFSMYDVVIHHNLERLLGGGRMPGYHKVSDKMTPEEYLQAVVSGKLKDPVLTFLLRCGRTPVKAVLNYLEDEESCNCAALMEWRNPFFHTS